MKSRPPSHKSEINSQQFPITKEYIVMKTRKQLAMRTKIRSFGLGLVLTLGLSYPLAAAIIITTNDTGGADAYVESTTPTTNWGNGTTLLVKDSGAFRKSYLRFGLSPVTNTVLTATFGMTLTSTQLTANGTQTLNVYGLNNGDPGESWGETTITWNNAPQNDTTSASGLLSNTTFLGSITVTYGMTAGTLLSFSGANLVTFLNSDTDHLATFIVVGTGGINAAEIFASRENGTYAAPTLTMDVVPEASTTAFLLYAAAACFVVYVYRRRRGGGEHPLSFQFPPVSPAMNSPKNTTQPSLLTGCKSTMRFVLSALLVATMNLPSLFAAEPLLALTFEKDESMEGVKIGSSTKIIDEGYESACALEACSEQNTFQSFLTTQRYPVDENKEVLALSFNYKTSEAIVNEFIAMIFYYGEGGEQLFVEYVKIPASDQWKSFSYTGKKPPKGTLSAALTLRLAGAPAQASVCIDNLVLTKKWF
jgi:hypothetical protein